MSTKNLLIVIGLCAFAIALGAAVNVYLMEPEPSTAAPVASESPVSPEEVPPVVDTVEKSPAVDPLLMSLGMKTWVWEVTNLNDGTTVVPKEGGVFTLTFNADGTFGAATDCNSVGGQYVAEGPTLQFTEIMSTEMFCEGSQETDFVGYLSNTSGYHYTTEGALILDLKFDSGTVTFR